MAGGGTIYIPVLGSFRGMGAQFTREMSGAASKSMRGVSAEMEKGGRAAGQKAGKATADGLASSQKDIERVSRSMASARKAEADAAGNVRVAEARLAEVRSNSGASASQVARAEEGLATAHRKQAAAGAEAASVSADLDRLRSGEPAKVASVARAEGQLITARNRSEDATGKVRVAETRLTELQNSGKATKAQLASAEEGVAKARRDAAGASDSVKSKELLLTAAQDDAAASARRAADATEQLGTKSQETSKKLGAVSGGFDRAAGKVRNYSIAAAAALGAIGKQSFDAASAAEQSAGAMEAVFGKATGQMSRYAGQAAQTVGLSTSQYSQLSAVLGSQLKNLGVAQNELGGSTNQLIGLGADLSAQFGGTAADAVEALSSLFRGERDPIEKYGVSIKQAGIDAWKSANGMDGLTGSAEVNADRMATMALLLEQTGSAQGAFGREAGTAAGQQQRFAAEMENAKAQIGEALLPVISRAAQAFGGLARFMGENKAAAYGLVGVLGAVASAYVVLRGAAAVAAIAQGVHAAATGVGSAALTGGALATGADTIAMGIATAATWAFNAAMAVLTSPITWIIVAIAAVVAALVWFFTQTDIGKAIITAAWNGIKAAVGAVVNWFTQTAWPALKAAFTAVGNVAMWLWNNAILPAWNGIKAAISVAWTVISTIFSAFMTVMKYVGAIVAAVIYGVILVAWNLLKAGIALVWMIIRPIFDLFMVGMRAIGAAATWLWTTAIMPAWNGIKAAAQAMWNIVKVVFGWFKTGIQVLGNVIRTVANVTIVPIWNAIKFGAQLMWNGINIIFGWIKLGMQTLGNIIRAVANVTIIPVWNALKAAAGFMWDKLKTIFGWIKSGWEILGKGISWVVDNIVKPAFEGIKSALGRVRDFFGTVVDGIKTVWEKLKGYVAKPINFVIETVWNNGLLKAWNKVASFLPGLKEMAPLSPVAFAKGGPVPMSDGAKRGKDSVHALMMPGEHVWDVMDVVRAGGQNAMYAMRAMIERGIPFTWDGARGLSQMPSDGLKSLSGGRERVGGQPTDALGLLHGLPGFAEGGGVAAPPAAWEAQLARGHAWAKSRDGRPYVLGGSANGGGGTDCSGFMSGIANVIQGGDGARQWATMSFNGGGNNQAPSGPQGFKAGLKKGFSIGVTNGGAAGGHTAGTLSGVKNFGTVNVESGGSHNDVAYGARGAVGADDGYFRTRYHLPIGADGAFESGGGSGPSPEEQMGLIKKKISELLDKALNPIKSGMGSIIGTPPPEWLGIPPKMLDWSKKQVLDEFFKIVGGLGDKLRSVYDGAKKIKNVITGAVKSVYSNTLGRLPGLADGGAVTGDMGLYRDRGGYLPTGQSIVRNETGKPEAVFNWDQLKLLRQLLDLARTTGESAAKETAGGVADFFGFKTIYDKVAEQVDKAGQGGAGATEGATTGQGEGAVATTEQGQGAIDGAQQNLDSAQSGLDDTQSTLDAAQSGQGSATTDGATTGGAYVAPTYGDPNATYETREEPSTTVMPDMSSSGGYSGAIAEAAKRANVGRRGAIIGMITALVESGDPMKMWANSGNPESLKFPHDAVGSDHDSVGLFQQRATWGSTADRMNPGKSAGLFYNALKGVGGWESMEMGAAAQAVQRSAYPDRYSGKIGRGTELVNKSGLFDTGGWLMPGITAAVNKTGKPEAILTAAQWSGIDNMLEALPSAAEFKAASKITAARPMRAADAEAEGSTGGRGRETHLHYHTEDVTDAVRRSTREQKRLARSDALVGGW